MSTTSPFRKTRLLLLAGASRGLGYAMSVPSVHNVCFGHAGDSGYL